MGCETIESRKVPNTLIKKVKFYFFRVTTISMCFLIPQLKKKLNAGSKAHKGKLQHALRISAPEMGNTGTLQIIQGLNQR